MKKLFKTGIVIIAVIFLASPIIIYFGLNYIGKDFVHESLPNYDTKNEKREAEPNYPEHKIIPDTINAVVSNTKKQEQKTEPATLFFIKDSSNYSPTFLKEFKKTFGCYKSVSLINDTIIIDNDHKGFILIPTDLPLNSTVVYKVKKGSKPNDLKVRRINYSTIKYEFNGGIGLADLQPAFYLGCEGTFEDKNGITYGMNKYIDYAEKEHSKYILVGVKNIEESAVIVDGKETPNLIRQK